MDFVDMLPRLSPECQYTTDVLRAYVQGETCPSMPSQIEWSNFERILERNRLIPLFYSMVPCESLPERCAEKWQRISVDVLFRYSHAARASQQLFTALKTEGVPSVALRGMALAERIYSKPEHRPMGDVDVQIHSTAKDSIEDKLKRHGLTPAKKLRSQFVYDIENIKIELHWSFLTPKRYRNACNFDQWLDSRESFSTMGGDIPCLKPENELSEIICHAFIHHELDRALQLVDIGLLIKQSNLDWDYVGKWCETASLTKLFSFTLGYIDHFLELGLQEHLERTSLRLSEKNQRLYEAYLAYMFLEDSRAHYFQRKKNLVAVAEKPSTKARQLIRFLDAKEVGKMLASGRRQDAAR